MGEIAEMMIDGTMCQTCGEWIDGGNDGPGYPVSCAGCRVEERSPPRFKRRPKNLASASSKSDQRGPHQCPDCDRSFGSHVAQLQHAQDKHGKAAGP